MEFSHYLRDIPSAKKPSCGYNNIIVDINRRVLRNTFRRAINYYCR